MPKAPYVSKPKNEIPVYNIIRAGYRLTVDSWENDLDNPRTIQQDGLGLEEVQFITNILNLYRSGNLGNIYEPSEKDFQREMTALKEVVAKHKIALSLLGLEDNSEYLRESVHESILYKYLGGGEFYARVCEKQQVEYIPEEIKILNVTNILHTLK